MTDLVIFTEEKLLFSTYLLFIYLTIDKGPHNPLIDGSVSNFCLMLTIQVSR